ncbi:hypothetical protein D3C83_192810 [compost metagenome]
MLPVLVTKPVTSTVPPGWIKPCGQIFVTSMLGLLVPGHIFVSELVTPTPQMLVPMAVNVSAYGPQESTATL